MFYFKVIVLEEQFAITYEIKAGPFETLENAYKTLVYFPIEHNLDPRSEVIRMQIWLEAHPLVDVIFHCGAFLIRKTDLPNLDLTLEQFNTILEKLEREDQHVAESA